EQARDLHGVDIRSDLYSLGCTFFYLLTGQVPFPGGTSLEKLVRHGTEEPVPVEQLRADVPPDVSMIVAKLLQKDPAKRFQAPAELAAALAPLSQQGAGTFTPLGVGHSAGDLPSTTESPWSDLFGSDEYTALAGTIPASLAPTPMSSLAIRRKKDVKRPESRHDDQRWLRVAVIVAALAVGFALGALTLAKW
ncbi:MAG: hypothetical protein ACJ8F7_19925, partial [Gemmataceae bacterium]